MKKYTYNIQVPEQVNPVERLINNAIACHRQGNLLQAEHYYGQALEMQPGNAYVLNMLGVLNSQKGNFGEGEKLLRKAIKKDPRVADYHANLGQCLQEQKKFAASESAYKKALQIEPGSVQALFGLGNVGLHLKKPEQAIRYYKKTIEIEPRYLPACNNLGNLYRELKMYDQALEMFNRVISLKPDFAEAWYNLGVLQFSRENGQKAKEALEQAIHLKPDYYRAHFKLGDCHGYLLHDLPAAIQDYDRTIAIKPDFIPAYLHKAGTYNSMGKFAEAENTLRQALEVDASAIDVYLKLIFSKMSGDADVDKVHDLLENRDLTRKQLVDIHFALGKIYEDRQEYETAFRHYKQGNDSQREITHYQAEKHHQFVDAQINNFTPAFIDYHAKLGLDTDLPVFIVGMPRSGTTLTEQILASHPLVHGGGETEIMHQVIARFRELVWEKYGKDANPGEVMLERHELQQVASVYQDYFDQFAAQAQRVTEKLPGNFEQLGLITMLFPRARIIHCRRDPLDTCMSIYSHHFTSQHQYSNDMRDLAMHYREYLRLMEYWQQILGDRIFHVQYEELINDQEGVSRQIINYVGLDWDEKCLQFYEAERPVKTLSQWQVRQKIYTGSIGHWKHYRPWIAPLIEALGDVVKNEVTH